MDNQGDSFLERELSYKLMGYFFDIRNQYGPYHQERVYDRVLQERLGLEHVKHTSQPKIEVYSLATGKKIAIYIPDLLVENKIIVELKAKPFTTRDDEMQGQEYLKTSAYEIIYLVNFGEPNFRPRRFIFTNDRKPFIKLIQKNPSNP